jgi:hypothetical protein
MDNELHALRKKPTPSFKEVVEWFDPIDVMPDPGVMVLIVDRLGVIGFGSWQQDGRCWVEQFETQQGAFSYQWKEEHCHAWAYVPSGPAV